jgi:hypothetical protein
VHTPVIATLLRISDTLGQGCLGWSMHRPAAVRASVTLMAERALVGMSVR